MGMLQSDNWKKTSISFLVSNVIFIIGINQHFVTIPNELYAVITGCWICMTLTVYYVEWNSRLLFKIYIDQQRIEEKQSIILKLFPEALVIANLKSKEFDYYNEAFKGLYFGDNNAQSSTS